MNAAKQAELSLHVRCVAHTINLATQRGLQVSQINRLSWEDKAHSKVFAQEHNSYGSFDQSLLELPQHKLINDVPTRWNSSYDMMQRFLEQQTAIEAVLLTKDVKKNAKDVHFLSDLCNRECHERTGTNQFFLELYVPNNHAAVLFEVQNVVYKLFSYSRYTDLG